MLVTRAYHSQDHRHFGRMSSTENNTQCFSRKNANTNVEPEIIVHVISHVQVSKSTKFYIHFHNFPESSAKNFNVVSHLQVSKIPKIKSKKVTGTWNPSRMTTFKGQSAKRHSNKKNFKSGQNQPNSIFIFTTFRNHRKIF